MAEISVVSSRKARLQKLANDGSPSAAQALLLAQDPSRFLSTVQIGITLVGILAGAFGGATISGKVAAAVANVSALEPYSKAIGIAVALKYRGPAFLISGVSGAGTRDLTEAVMRFLETGEAPAQGNLSLPVIVEKVRKATPVKK